MHNILLVRSAPAHSLAGPMTQTKQRFRLKFNQEFSVAAHVTEFTAFYHNDLLFLLFPNRFFIVKYSYFYLLFHFNGIYFL